MVPWARSSQLTTFRLEAQEELVAVETELIDRAAAIVDFNDTSVFVLERAENGDEVPPEWFGMNPADGEDSAEVIDSSGEEEGGAEEEGEGEAPEVRADGQPQLDRASSNESRPSEPATTEEIGRAHV